MLDRVKPLFFKRVLGVSKFTKNRLVYIISETITFVEELQKQYCLPRTDAFVGFLRQQEEKFACVDQEIWQTPALMADNWKRCLQESRHVLTRHAAHGFHHLICSRPGRHTANDDCSCLLCDGPCGTYHLLRCQMNSQSLSFWAAQ